MNNNSDMFKISDEDILQILNESTINDKKPNQEKAEFERLCNYISTNVLNYPPNTPLPEPLVNSVRNAVSVLKLQSSGFTCIDLLMILKNQKDKINYCVTNFPTPFESDRHKLNYVLKIAKNAFIDSLLYREERQAAATQQRYIINRCHDNTGLKERFKQQCNYNEQIYNITPVSKF